ncbi:MAG: bacterial transcriptional activator domain-containing protein [Firmicutes bacterium]|nr:bacterial transcriptional activator domain-containing protein [Bacillota bacterium]
MKVDSEQFEKLLGEAGRASRKTEKIQLLHQAIELYRGRYLSSVSDHQTVMFQQTYYHNLYVDAVCQLAESYEEEMDFDNMERLLERALLIESMEERLHCLLLKAYIGKNRLSLAEQYYHKTVLLLEDRLGEEIAEEMRSIYRELLKRQHSRETDLQRISADLLSFSEKRDSAFYCQYGVFQNIYELEFRRKERMDYPLTLVLISVYSPQEEDALTSARKENAGMRHLRAALADRLRHGDIFTRYSNTQFLVMLTGCEEGDVDNVMDHVLEEYYSKARRGGANIQYSALEQRGQLPEQQ